MTEKTDGVTTREAFVVWVVTLVLAPLIAFVLAGAYYFDRPFWSDEVLSWLIASDPSFQHGMGALAGGVDTNAPLLHFLFRAVGSVFGATPLVYRLTCWAGMAAAVSGLYFLLRRNAKAGPAAFGCLCFAALPIVIAHATEARFYSFELAAFVWTAVVIERRKGRETVGNAATLTLYSAALCGIHYFGIVALGALILCETRSVCRIRADRATDRNRQAERALRILFPTIAGPAITACLLPLLIAQRAAMHDAGGTWVPNEFFVNLHTTFAMLLPAPALVTILFAIVLSFRLIGRAAIVEALRPHRVLLLASVLYIAAMFAFDRLVQPVFVPRYFIIALPALAALMAGIAATWPTRVLRLATLAVGIAFVGEFLQIRIRAETPSGRSAAGLIASVRSIDADEPIISDWLGHALPIAIARPDLSDRIVYVADMRLHEPGFDQAIRYERQMAACVQRFYGLPRERQLDAVDRLNRFVLLTEFPETIAARFPTYRSRALGTVTYELSRSEADHADGSSIGSAGAE